MVTEDKRKTERKHGGERTWERKPAASSAHHFQLSWTDRERKGGKGLRPFPAETKFSENQVRLLILTSLRPRKSFFFAWLFSNEKKNLKQINWADPKGLIIHFPDNIVFDVEITIHGSGQCSCLLPLPNHRSFFHPSSDVSVPIKTDPGESAEEGG